MKRKPCVGCRKRDCGRHKPRRRRTERQVLQNDRRKALRVVRGIERLIALTPRKRKKR